QDVEKSKEILEPALAREIIAKTINFHILVAEASHNLPYIMFVRSIMEWATRKLEGWIPSPDEQRYSYISHKEMFEAIVSSDVKLAQRLMFEHIEKMGVLVSHRGKK
ncbi:MAG: FCD domain-containing protein, partial [Desulfobacteraceae bacterium]|nr:FCD domain-containing protein [Desulfobacteraceae bacterium]